MNIHVHVSVIQVCIAISDVISFSVMIMQSV